MKYGDIISDKYRIERLLGVGGTSRVYLCTNLELGNHWALKYVPKAAANKKTMNEIEILKKLSHVNLPKLADVFTDDKGIYIIESYIGGVNLEQLLLKHGSFTVDKVVEWFLELCSILGYMHGIKPKPIIYGDMKPSNIMLTEGNRLALIDFGISKELTQYQIKEGIIAGTGAYAAPEQLIKGGSTDQRTDIYNLGVTIHHLLNGEVPSGSRKRNLPYRDKAVVRLEAILEKCTRNKPEDRYQRVEDIQRELSAVKRMLMLAEERRKLLFGLEIALAAVLSAVTYAAIVLGLLMPG